MKKFVLSLVAAFAISPVMASEPVDLSSFGLGNLQPVSEAAGMKVRGMSSNASSSSLVLFNVLLFDPVTKSSVGFNASSISSSSEELAGTGEDSLAASNNAASIVFPTITLDVADGASDGFVGSVLSGGVLGAGQSGAGFAFNWNLPTFPAP